MIAPPPLLYGFAFVVGLLLDYSFPNTVVPSFLSPPTGLALLSGGAVLAIWSRHTMEQAGTPANPSRPTTALVVTGPFRLSRNPMYLARTLLYLGLALLANAAGVVAVLIPLTLVMHYGVIKREERYLDAKFGDAYRQYRAAVRRWL